MAIDDATERIGTESAPIPDEGRGEAPARGRLTGRRVLVVGGGQQDHGVEDPPMGNGRAMSVLFAREGASVAIADVDQASADATAELVRDEGASAAVVVADAADEEASAASFTEAARRWAAWTGWS
jgi:NAD(P)-dependent dehydrogenase (short-subunit alcohol dehydrogenase family)